LGTADHQDPQVIIRKASRLVSRLSNRALGIVTIGSVLGVLLATKLLLHLPLSRAGVQVPDYGLTTAGAFMALGLLGADARGLALAIVGAVVAGLAALLEIAQLTQRWDAFLYGLPLAIGGMSGLALFAHGMLHPSPSLVQRGIDIARASVVAFALALVVVEFVVSVRQAAHEDSIRTVAIAGAAVLAALLVLLVLAQGAPRRRRRRLEEE
jgi:hypothetical protein